LWLDERKKRRGIQPPTDADFLGVISDHRQHLIGDLEWMRSGMPWKKSEPYKQRMEFAVKALRRDNVRAASLGIDFPNDT
jgi:hypothetical protein